MKISQKLIDIAKRGACTLVASLLISIPFKGKSETKVESNDSNQTKIVQEYKEEVKVDLSDESDVIEKAIMIADGLTSISNKPSFVLVTHWEKTENYKKDNDYSKGNREYKRTIYRFKANENYNNEYFNNDIEKIAKFFRDNKDSSDIFDIVETYEQIVTVTPEDEDGLNTEEDIVEIEGTNIILKIDSQEVEKVERLNNVIKLVGIFLMYSAYAGLVITKFKKY